MGNTIKITSEIVKQEIINYLKYSKYKEGLTKDQKKNFRSKVRDMKLIGGVLKINENHVEKIIICGYEAEKKRTIIKNHHEPDHLGINKLVALINEKYYGIKQEDVKNFVSRCEFCQRIKPPKVIKQIGAIIPIAANERLIIDLIDFSRFSSINNGMKYCYTMIDSFSKFSFVYPVASKHGCIFSDILDKLFQSEGPWKIVHTDNGKEFINRWVKTVLDRYGIQHVRGRPYHPQSQGQVERFNRTLKEKLMKINEGGVFKWQNNIRGIVYRYNNTPHRATNTKPFILYRGKNPSVPEQTTNMTTNAIMVRERYQTYALSYRRELEINHSANITIGDKVLLMKDYMPNRLTSECIIRNSLYEDKIYEVKQINNDENITITDSNSNERLVLKTRIKKFIISGFYEIIL